jgi:hypothetical protein
MTGETPMPFRNPFLALLGPALFLSACMSPQPRVGNKEDLLAAAGFTVRPANTPERQAVLRHLPPDRFVRRARGNQFVYVFADPLVCNCLYIGDEAAYARYRKEAQQRVIANERLLEAEMNEDTTWTWGWSY